MIKRSDISPLRQRQRAAATDTLLEAAEAAIGRKGFDKATMHDIAAEVGCATGTLYLYFTGKEELLSAIMARHSKAMTQLLYRSMQTTDTPLAKLRRNTWAFLEYFNAHKLFFRVFYTATSPSPEDSTASRLRDTALKDYQKFKSVEVEVVRQAQKQGLLRTDLPAEALVDFMHGVAAGIVGRWAVAAKSPPLDEQMRLLWGLQTGGIGARETAP